MCYCTEHEFMPSYFLFFEFEFRVFSGFVFRISRTANRLWWAGPINPLEVGRGLARARRKTTNHGRPNCRSGMGARGSDLDGIGHLHQYVSVTVLAVEWACCAGASLVLDGCQCNTGKVPLHHLRGTGVGLVCSQRSAPAQYPSAEPVQYPSRIPA